MATFTVDDVIGRSFLIPAGQYSKMKQEPQSSRTMKTLIRNQPTGLIENAQRHFQGSLFGGIEYVPNTALTIVCTINVSIDCKKNKVLNPYTRKNI